MKMKCALLCTLLLLQIGAVGAFPQTAATPEKQDEIAAFNRGVVAAERDISAGKLVVLRRGLQLVPKSRRKQHEAREAFFLENGITVRYGTDMTQATPAYRGYQDRMDREIKARFGQDIWERLDGE